MDWFKEKKEGLNVFFLNLRSLKAWKGLYIELKVLDYLYYALNVCLMDQLVQEELEERPVSFIQD